MSVFPPPSPQFEIRKSTSSMVDLPEPRYMSVEYFIKTYRCAISEIQLVMIDGKEFVDLESTKAKMLILRAKFS